MLTAAGNRDIIINSRQTFDLNYHCVILEQTVVFVYKIMCGSYQSSVEDRYWMMSKSNGINLQIETVCVLTLSRSSNRFVVMLFCDSVHVANAFNQFHANECHVKFNPNGAIVLDIEINNHSRLMSMSLFFCYEMGLTDRFLVLYDFIQVISCEQVKTIGPSLLMESDHCTIDDMVLGSNSNSSVMQSKNIHFCDEVLL